MRRSLISGLLALLAFSVACTNKKVSNPLANVGSKQPDKVLFDRSMDAMKHNRFDVARMTLQTLINTYPDSEFIARAKLAVADSWYAEGGSTAMQQAESNTRISGLLPNMPEAAEAALKVANIHYQQMEKADRDYTHAMRAEEEYRQVILQYPESKLLKDAKQRLREVQEVLAQREFNIGRFYYLRQAYPASIARLQTLVDRYPLYSGADETLFLLGQTYEAEMAMARANAKISEGWKAKMVEQFEKGASAAYSKIITRYPAMERAMDAKARLEALNQPVPRPTRAAMELNKKEVASRREPGMMSSVMGSFTKHPDMERATRVGEPTMVDPKPVNATEVVQAVSRAITSGGGTDNKIGVQTINGVPAPNQAPPRSDDPTPVADPAVAAPPDADPATVAEQPPAGGELTPNVAADPNELKPNVADPTALPPLQQNNELADGNASATASSSSSKDELVDISSSKKKKKGLAKLNPF